MYAKITKSMKFEVGNFLLKMNLTSKNAYPTCLEKHNPNEIFMV